MFVRLLVVVTILLASTSQALAEDVKQELDEVVVTASRVREKIKEAPVTINVVSEQEIEKVKLRNSAEVLQRIPGINSSSLGGESALTSIRIPTHFTNPYTLVLIDGVPTSGYGSGSAGSFSEINSDNIARIEVVKGPGSALYGSNAIGGIINVITKDPSAKPQVKLWTEFGDYGQWRSGLGGSGSGDKFSFNVDLNYINSDNWRESSAVDKKAGNIKLQYVPFEQSLLTFKLDYVNFDNESSGTLRGDDFIADWQQDYYTFTYAKLEKYSPLLSYTHYFDDAEFKTTLAVRQLDHEVLPTYGIRPQGPRTYVGSFSEIEDSDVDLQFLYNRDFDLLRSKIVAGVDFERGNSETDTYSLSVKWDRTVNKFTDYTVGKLSKSYDVTTKVGAPYLQLQASPTEHLRLTAGGRYDSLEYEVDDKLGTGDSGDMDFSQFSPKIGATYDITPSLNTYVSYSEGFVVPTTSQLFTSSWASSDLDAEEAKNYEIGVRSSFWQRKLALDVALYSMDITNKIVTKDINSWVKKYVNAGETSQRGVEVTATVKPVDYASLAFAYTYARNKYEEYITDGVDYSDNSMERSPEHRFNARLTVLPIQHLWVELEMDAESSQYSDPANRHEYSRPTLFNLRANYDWREWSFWAHILNLTDQEYASYVSYSSSDDMTTYFPGSPLTFLAGISYRWGGDK
ncbi:MAG: TonB-dependent receptor [Desulfobulbaceae bacterium]|nr:TonB-dependent receptor [Desulfobulbaceae bacterium]